MPEKDQIVFNTGPILAIVAATGGLKVLKSLYKKVVVPKVVSEELLCAGHKKFAKQEFKSAY